jgi:hypothetical protein
MVSTSGLDALSDPVERMFKSLAFWAAASFGQTRVKSREQAKGCERQYESPRVPRA